MIVIPGTSTRHFTNTTLWKMTFNHKYLILCACSLLLLGRCKTDYSKSYIKNEKFLSDYGNVHFEIFKNYSVFVREWNRGQGPTIMIVNHKIDSSVCSLPFTLILDQDGESVKEIKGNWMDTFGSCNIDTILMKKLALELSSMKASYIMVDSNDNVFVQTIYGESRPNLVKFSDSKHIPVEYKNNWIARPNGWFERLKIEETK